MPIERILFTTKFRELSYNSLEPLLVLKKAGLKEIIFCNVISRQDVGFVPFGGYLKEEEDRLRQEARIRFEGWQKSFSDEGIASRIVISVGDPVPKILRIAEEEMVDLIVVGQKKKESVEDFFAGTNTMQIVTRSNIPSLISKYVVACKIDGQEYEKVNDHLFEAPMLVMNWTEECQHALDLLISLQGIVRKAHVFHNLNVKISKQSDAEELCDKEEACRERLKETCDRLKSHGIEAEAHLGAGDLLEETLRVSRERQASMIVVGTTGKDRLHEILYKSISHQIAKMSELPTLLVP